MDKATLTIRLSSTLKEKLDKLSRERGLTLNSIIVQTLWNEIEKKGEKEM